MTPVLAGSRRRTLLELAALMAEASPAAMAIWMPTAFLFASPQPESFAGALQTAAALWLLLGALSTGGRLLQRAGQESTTARTLATPATAAALFLVLLWAFHTLPGLRPAPGHGGAGLWYYAALWAALLGWRATGGTRDLSRQGLASSFQIGLFVAAALGAALALTMPPDAAQAVRAPRQAAALFLFWGFLASSLAALQLARLHDTTLLADGVGDRAPVFAAALPWARAPGLLLPAALLPALGGLLALLWSPAGFGFLLGLLAPIWVLFRLAASGLIAGLFWLLGPFVQWLDRLSREMQNGEAGPQESLPTPFPNAPTTPTDPAGAGAGELAFYIVIGVVVLLLIVVALRRAARLLTERDEELPLPAVEWGPPEPPAPALFEPAAKPEATPTELLAADNVRNLYANVNRLAARRGALRPPDLSPDHWLPALCATFPGSEPALEAITLAYLRVHYGDIPTDPAELEELRAGWESVRARWS